MKTPKELLEEARVIAVVGCSDKPWRDSHQVALFLKRAGYRVYAVNPTLREVFGEPAYPDVTSVPEHVDIVDVFRRMENVPAVVEDAIAAGAGAVWLQQGITHPEAEKRAADAGLHVVANLCIAVAFRMLRVRGPAQQEAEASPAGAGRAEGDGEVSDSRSGSQR
ncbi:MAG TPA: CoA-binding protein [Candidatus Kapabacteria bacterium]|nr:CoA-binding protein [Candidatus Kapabacteria bacterium]